MISALEIFGLPQDYLNGGGHFANWSKEKAEGKDKKKAKAKAKRHQKAETNRERKTGEEERAKAALTVGLELTEADTNTLRVVLRLVARELRERKQAETT